MYRRSLFMRVWVVLGGMNLFFGSGLTLTQAQEPEVPYRHQIAFPEDPFMSWTSPAYVKFTIIVKEGYDPAVVYFQDSHQVEFHYDFAVQWLEPFEGMTQAAYDAASLRAEGQEAILGAVLFPPLSQTPLNEYGIQLARYDAFDREEVVHWFNVVKAAILAQPGATAYYFPSYEQFTVAQQNRTWFEDQGLPVGSTAQWTEGSACYAEGWTLGRLVTVPGDEIDEAYRSGVLTDKDILLTDGVPAEIPAVAGILSRTASSPNSHVAILARSQAVPFAHVAVTDDWTQAVSLSGRTVYLAVTTGMGGGCDIKLFDAEALTDQDRQALMDLKTSDAMSIDPIQSLGTWAVDTNDLTPADLCHVGGKAANFGVLRRAIPENSPRAMAFAFDLWTAFLDQPLMPVTPMTVEPGEFCLLWADGDPEQGPDYLGFKLSKAGEALGLYDAQGHLIDSVTFGPQTTDVSWARSLDGAGQWQAEDLPSPGQANAANREYQGLVINEFMADNQNTLEDPDEPGEYPDWIELYNGTKETVTLNGLSLTDDPNGPTPWQIPVLTQAGTLREEIALRLGRYPDYASLDMEALAADLAQVRGLFGNPMRVPLNPVLREAVLSALQGFGFDPDQKIRFRSSTNMEDSSQFVGAGLYDSFSGLLASDLGGPSESPDGVFTAIRRVFASFYNQNAFLERLKQGINESDVGMGLLVHHSFPDEIEWANGVATMERERDNWSVTLITQKDAVSVTNPPVGVVPEAVEIRASPWGVSPWVTQPSSLVSLREGTVMTWEDDYLHLYDLLSAAGDQYVQLVPKGSVMLDLEFKKVAPGELIVKQIRPVPQPKTPEYEVPFLFGGARTYAIVQGRGGNVFTNHRLKSMWTLHFRHAWLEDQTLEAGLYDRIEVEFVNSQGLLEQASFDMADLEHTYQNPEQPFDPIQTQDTWTLETGSGLRTYSLHTEPLYGSPLTDPAVESKSFRVSCQVAYDQPVWMGDNQTADQEGVALYSPWTPAPDEAVNECVYDDPNGLHITTRYYMRWSFDPTSPTSVQFLDTTIKGLTPEPIVLTGYYSQSAGGGAHLCPMEFLFEPRLEPSLPEQTLLELQALDIRALYFSTGNKECRPTEKGDQGPYIEILRFQDARF